MRLLCCLLCCLLPALVAADVVVTNTNDAGAGSLRDAIATASPGETIYFDPALAGTTVNLNGGELLINKNLTIFGLGPFNTFIDANIHRVFHVAAGVVVTLAHMQVSGFVRIGEGGTILNHGELTLKNMVLSGGFADEGAAVYSDGPRLTVRNGLFDSNIADVDGGGIYMAAGILDLQNTTLSGNTAGGGVGTSGSGGGIYVTGSGTTAFVVSSTLAGNAADTGGGGLFNFGAIVTLTNSTVTGNEAAGLGGGVANWFDSQLTLENSTVTLNKPCAGCNSLQGGGVYNQSSATATLYSTLVADNTAALGPDLSGPFTSNGFNLITDVTGSAGITDGLNNDQVNPVSGLMGLSSAGGPTPVHPLMGTSAAIDQGECPGLGTDQRGFHDPTSIAQRAVDQAPVDASDGCDVGAYEEGAVQNQSVNVDATVLLSGPYDTGGLMTTALSGGGLLPAAQPFSGPPWNYPGTETLGTTTDITDWVLVELRTASPSSGLVTLRKAGLLRNDGNIRAASGVGFIRFSGMNRLERYYNVVIYTRNHLSVMSAYPAEHIATIAHDFTDGFYHTWGFNTTNAVEPGLFATWGGDGDANGSVTAFDFLNTWLPINGGPPGYNGGDFNLDGVGTAFDFLTVWLPANGLASQVP